MKALAEVQSFQKQKLLLRAPLDPQHQNSKGIDFTAAVVVNYTCFVHCAVTSAKISPNLRTQKQQ